MNPTRRILPIALVAALLGASVGAFVMRAPKSTADNTATTATVPAANTTATNQALPATTTETLNPEQAAFRDGFEEGFLAAQDNEQSADYRASLQQRSGYAPSTRASRVSNSSGQSYNHYTRTAPAPQKRSFWQKHRDKLTVAAGAGGGALVGGLLGGKKGALIGGLAGGGGSALYTYKIRKKDRQY